MRTDALDFTDVQLRKPALPRARAHTHRHTNTNSISWRKRSGPLGCLQPHLHGWTRAYHHKHPAEEDGKSMMDARQGWWLGGELSRILSGLASVAFALPPSCPSDTWNHGHTNTHARLRRFLVPCFVLTVPALTDANHSLRKHTGHGRMRTTMRETTQIWQQAILRPHPPIPPALRTIEPSSCKSCTWSV